MGKYNGIPGLCQEDVWDKLSKEKRPIIVYGMGNGADKLLDRFSLYGIEVADFFASDGFVRGHFFKGKRVKSFSEIKSEYEDFVIVVSFASRRDDVIDIFLNLDKEYDLYIPDLPIADTNVYFDKDFYNSNYSKFEAVYNLLADDYSKNLYASIINYKLSGKLEFLLDFVSDADESYSLLNTSDARIAFDAGAYNGDTVMEMKQHFPSLNTVVAIEPDKKNFSKLLKYSEAETEIDVKCINAATWDSECTLAFAKSGNRNSTASASASFEHKMESVNAISIDSIAKEYEKVDYIKYDVEGAETEAVIGSIETIKKCKPDLLVSAYHKSKDLYHLPLLINEICDDYKIYLRRLRCVPAWEMNIIAKI